MQEKNLIKKLESNRPTLSSEESLRIWENVESKLPVLSPTMSPFSVKNIFKKTKNMSPLILILILALSGGATAFASDSSKPGDFLFPLERTIENAQLSLAFTDEEKALLTKTFTEERLNELREIIDEEISVSPSNNDINLSSTSTASSTLSDLEIEANIYTDTTVVKIELGDKKFYFETKSNDQGSIITDIKTHFPMLTGSQITEALNLETEDRSSRPKDKGVVTISNNGETRINTAVEALLKFLDQTNTDEINRQDLLSLLSTEVEGVTAPAKVKREKDSVRIGNEDSRVEIRVNDDGDSRIEIRQGENRVRIEEKSGEVKVKKSDKNEDAVLDDRNESKELNSTTSVNEINRIDDEDNDSRDDEEVEDDNRDDTNDDHGGDRKDKDRDDDREDRDGEDD